MFGFRTYVYDELSALKKSVGRPERYNWSSVSFWDPEVFAATGLFREVERLTKELKELREFVGVKYETTPASPEVTHLVKTKGAK